jgi:serine phosphatase RsbU (regulator of sigma subunit)
MAGLDGIAVADTDEALTDQTISFLAAAIPSQPAPTDAPAHLLLVLSETAAPRHFPLRLLPLTIGRVAPSELVLDSGTVSRRHCRLDMRNGDIVLTDLESTNGTFVNGERVIAAVTLQDGADINVGGHTLRYHRRSQQEMAGWDALDRELGEASDYVLSILPQPITSGPVLADWFYQPCTRLGGDTFGYQMLDSRCFAAFMLEVAGHGAGAALFSVTVANALRQRMLPGTDFRDPGAVIRGLNRVFPIEQHHDLFFTVWYGVYDVTERMLTFATAGHHPAFLLSPGSLQPSPLGTRNPSIGIAADREVIVARSPIPPGSTLFLFSDGVFEITDRDGREWDLSQILALLPEMAEAGGPRRLYNAVRSAARPGPLEDDFSALTLHFV